ncbi:MAG: prolipoprotein diacylglyceryl transferase [Coriobacteriia bacterium]|nr:prolipoprotein diacylglyceryl transferase [Coriobacteriia bacterium]
MFEVHWYGLAYIVGIAIAAAFTTYFLIRWGYDPTLDDMLTITLGVTIGILVGSRLAYILFYGGSYYWLNPAKILAVSDGGMSFHGGLTFAVIGGAIAARFTSIPLPALIDAGFVGAPLGLGLGRFTNFINGELWGSVTEMPWGVVFTTGGPLPRHPTQLYESFLEGIVLFTILLLLALRRPPPARWTIFATFLLGYGTFRFMVEFLRQPDAQIGYLGGNWLTMGMVLSLPMIVSGIALLIWSRKHA